MKLIQSFFNNKRKRIESLTEQKSDSPRSLISIDGSDECEKPSSLLQTHEISQIVISYINDPETLALASRTCKTWNKNIKSLDLWLKLQISLFPTNYYVTDYQRNVKTPKLRNWKMICIDCYTEISQEQLLNMNVIYETKFDFSTDPMKRYWEYTLLLENQDAIKEMLRFPEKVKFEYGSNHLISLYKDSMKIQYKKRVKIVEFKELLKNLEF